MNPKDAVCRLLTFVVVFSLLFAAGPAPAMAAQEGVPPALNDPSIPAPIFPSGSAETVLPDVFGDPPLIAGADAGETALEKEAAGAEVPSLAAYGKAFLPDLLGGTKRIFSGDNTTLALIGLGLTGLAFTADRRVQVYFEDRKPMEHVAKIGDRIGKGPLLFGLGIAFLGTGEILGDKQAADTGIASIESMAVAGLASEGLKFAVHRKRPNGGDNMSFPSGHATMTSAFAASVSAMYDWNPAIAVPLFATAAFVGASRIQAQEHHLSDVLAGFTLGTLVGASFAKYHQEKDAAAGGGSSVRIMPFFEDGFRGIMITGRF